jgi:muramoyltetrapeptide carboxypeptidase
MHPKNADACVKSLRDKGYEVLLGKTVYYPSENYFSAPDEIKIPELQAMLDAPEIKAILFGRGGYGLSRIIDQLDFSAFKKNPKWLIGFSDITVILNHIQRHYGIASIHSSMCSAFNNKKQADNAHTLLQCLSGKRINITCTAHPKNNKGKVSGKLVGGNLSLLANSIGTSSEFNSDNSILLIEDIGEYLYHIDRMMVQLKRSGKLKKLSALIVGGFTEMKDTEKPFGKSLEDIILEHVREYGYPVCFEFPVSHGDANLAVKMGMNYQLSVGSSKVTLKEIS